MKTPHLKIWFSAILTALFMFYTLDLNYGDLVYFIFFNLLFTYTILEQTRKKRMQKENAEISNNSNKNSKIKVTKTMKKKKIPKQKIGQIFKINHKNKFSTL